MAKQIYDWAMAQIPMDGKRIIAIIGHFNNGFYETDPIVSYDQQRDVFVSDKGGEYVLSEDTSSEKNQKSAMVKFFGKKQ